MVFFKLKAYLMGFLLSLLPTRMFIKLVDGSHDTKIGMDIVNDDVEAINKFKAQIVRVNRVDLNVDMVRYFAENKIDYYIQIGRSEETDLQIAMQIIDCHNTLNGLKPPLFYSVVNEDNDFSWVRIENIYTYIQIHHGKYIPITKGSYTSIVESAAMKKYRDHLSNNAIPVNMPHLIHFYLKPYNQDNVIDNFLRVLMLRYMIFALSRKGIPSKNVIISESHDASKTGVIIVKKEEVRMLSVNGDGSVDGDKVIKANSDGTYTVQRYEGDFVFASKEGWQFLESLYRSLGIRAGLYYHQPFLNYKGNTVLEARK